MSSRRWRRHRPGRSQVNALEGADTLKPRTLKRPKGRAPGPQTIISCEKVGPAKHAKYAKTNQASKGTGSRRPVEDLFPLASFACFAGNRLGRHSPFVISPARRHQTR